MPSAAHGFVKTIVVVRTVQISVIFNPKALRRCFWINALRKFCRTRLHIWNCLPSFFFFATHSWLGYSQDTNSRLQLIVCVLARPSLENSSYHSTSRSTVASKRVSQALSLARLTLTSRSCKRENGFTFKRQPLSNPCLTIVLALFAGASWAQSDDLLNAVRIRSETASTLADNELDACLHAKRPCAQLQTLSLLRGTLLLSQGKPTEAATQLQMHPGPPRLEALRDWYLAEALSYSRRVPQAMAILKRTANRAPPWLKRRMTNRLLELQLENGMAAAARPGLEAAAKERATAESLYSRALARLRTKDTNGARSDALAIATAFPAHPHAALAMALLEDTGGFSFSIAEHLARIETFLSLSRAKDALAQLAELEQHYKIDSSLVPKLALLRGQALLSQGKDTDAEVALTLAQTGTREIAADALMLTARRQMRLLQNEASRATFETVASRYPKDPNSDEADYFAAWLSLSLHEDERAAAAFEQFEVKHPFSKRRDEARWFQGYALYRSKHYVEARQVVRGLVDSFSKSQLVPQARYWATRAAQLSKLQRVDAGVSDGGRSQDVDFNAEYRQVVASFPQSYYALLAAQRLRENGETVANWFPPLQRAANSNQTPTELAMPLAFAKAGQFEAAAEATKQVIDTVSSAEQAETYAESFAAHLDFGAAYALANRHLWPAAFTAKSASALQLFYPKAYASAVLPWCESHSLDPLFSWSIMRRESAFKPDVVSSADARGLMQIIPPTMREIASRLKLPADSMSADDLYSPAVNIRFGTWYLNALMQRFKHPSLAAAGYNAGPTAVARWLKQRGQLELDEFVEEIPYKETRGYVKQVTADLGVYHQLEGAEPFSISLELPPAAEGGVQF